MKGADAVMIELALGRLGDRANVDVGFVFFGREELPFADSALSRLLEREPGLRTADAVIVMEPTDNAIHAGCLGNINAAWTFPGTQRPLGPPVARRQRDPPRGGRHRRARAGPRTSRASSTGCASPQVVSVTRIAGGIADNVVPDTATAHVNFRYAPGTSAEEAEALPARAGASRTATLEITGNAPSAPVATQNDARAAAHRDGRPRGRAQAGLDARSPSSPPPASTPSTSAPASRGSPTPATSRSRSPRSYAATRRWSASRAAEPGPRPACGTYPFVRLDEAKAAALARGIDVIDFGAGEPREETPPFIRRALAEAVEAEPVAGYPKAAGLPELRAAIADVGRAAGSAPASTRRPRSSRRSAPRRPSSAWRRSSAARARGSR